MVSPPDAGGRFLQPISAFALEATYDLFPTELASPFRASIVFESYVGPMLSPTEPNGIFDIYQAERGSQGWQTVRRISPSGPQALIPSAGGISSDHAYAFTHQRTIPGRPAGSLAGDKAGAVYVANPDGSFELLGKGSL
ncbi:MAG TPA: hypothetical protein VFP21_04670, partial [Solirubrobacterales bacterium]|nr:hypothetical protein [Solirubrobacterales bacterium]